MTSDRSSVATGHRQFSRQIWTNSRRRGGCLIGPIVRKRFARPPAPAS
ncbi:UNVERIFIED_CONTAM: hypothetical protein GTU68_012622 [Idotea baltica]|nr:hypothetical protein [Idotea baltica]